MNLLGWILLAVAQEGTLDVLDGETLYEGGWLFTAGYGFESFEKGRQDHSAVLSVHYGLLYNLQLSVILPYVFRRADPVAADGIGDASFLAKWRFQRWDGPGWALNLSAIGGIEFPTGSDDEALVPPVLQPGSGSWDPMVGIAGTYEPGRWRFNTFALYKRNNEGSNDFKFGDEFFAEIAVGNRFWLEPYPGPFMRGDLMLRYRHEWDSPDVVSTDLFSVGANWAFRPRPELDFQLSVEFPIRRRETLEEFTVFFTFGVRI